MADPKSAEDIPIYGPVNPNPNPHPEDPLSLSDMWNRVKSGRKIPLEELERTYEGLNPVAKYAKEKGQQTGQALSATPGIGVGQTPSAVATNEPAAMAQGDPIVDAMAAKGFSPPQDMVTDLSKIGVGGGAGGWQSTISPKTRAEFERGFGLTEQADLGALESQEQAAKHANAIRLAAFDKASAEVESQIGDAQGRYFSSMNELKKAEKIKQDSDIEVDNAMKEVRETVIDPNKFFSQRDTFTNIMLAINVAMGSYWSAFTGQNPALDIVNKAIDRDIRAQEVNMQNKRLASDTLLRRNMLKAGDLDKAKELTRIQMLEVARMQMEKAGMENASAVQNANYETLMSGLDAAKNKAMANHALQHAQFLAGSEGRAMAAGVGVEGGALKGLLEQARKDEARYSPALRGLIPGEASYVTTVKTKAEQAANFQALIRDMSELSDKLSRMNKIGGKLADFAQTPEYVLLNAKQEQAMSAQSKLLSEGVIREGEVTRYRQMLGDVVNPARSPEDSKQVLARLGGDMNMYMDNLRREAHVQAATPQYVQFPNMPTGPVRVYRTHAESQADMATSIVPKGTQQLKPTTKQ